MSASEILWRVKSLARDKIDQRNIVRGNIPDVDIDATGRSAQDAISGFRFPRPALLINDSAQYQESLLREADRIKN
ncbi:MAG: hypothetical protein AAF385_12345, partial [Pseudomonadota bacterium]